MTAPIRCPDCGSALQLSPATTWVPHAENGVVFRNRPLPTRAVETVIAACTGCEFIYELTATEQAIYRAGGV